LTSNRHRRMAAADAGRRHQNARAAGGTGSHLREDVEKQMRSGFSEQEAFGSAIKKIGQPRLLKTEFKKADCIGTFMKTYRILGVLWMALSGVLGTLFLFALCMLFLLIKGFIFATFSFTHFGLACCI